MNKKKNINKAIVFVYCSDSWLSEFFSPLFLPLVLLLNQFRLLFIVCWIQNGYKENETIFSLPFRFDVAGWSTRCMIRLTSPASRRIRKTRTKMLSVYICLDPIAYQTSTDHSQFNHIITQPTKCSVAHFAHGRTMDKLNWI